MEGESDREGGEDLWYGTNLRPVRLHVSIGGLRDAVSCNPLDVVKLISFFARGLLSDVLTTHDDSGFL